ncbi:hypothetical protein ABZU42_18180, partial [Micromonospora profundi]
IGSMTVSQTRNRLAPRLYAASSTDGSIPASAAVPEDVPPPVDDTPTLVDLASRRARRAAGESRSAKRRKASADAVDGAYWAGLRGEAK